MGCFLGVVTHIIFDSQFIKVVEFPHRLQLIGFLKLQAHLEIHECLRKVTGELFNIHIEEGTIKVWFGFAIALIDILLEEVK
jgi:hypothetical protein